ncbi:MAG TPA: hypothetical protein VIT38_17330 [Allosphingosinicella sp.]
MRVGIASMVALTLFIGCSAAPAAAQARVGCAPAPAIVLLPGFADPNHVFTDASASFRATAANFAAAYAQACRSGLLRGRQLIGAGPADPSRLFLLNAPQANVVSIYVRDDDDGAGPPAAGSLVLEYYFVTEDGAAHVPSVEDLGEAIYCHVQGATPREEEESGRCLVD